MCKVGLLVVAVLTALAVSQAAGAAAAPSALYITTEYSPPASMMDGHNLVGFSTDKVREIMSRAAIPYTLALLPWKRAYTSAMQRPDGCVFSTTRTPERENLFKWVGPTDEGEWVLLGLADRKLQIKRLEDARMLRIGTYFGDARDEYLRTRGYQVDPAHNDMINPQKLLMHRIDLWAASFRRGTSVLQQNGWSGRIVPVFTFARVQVYLACNRAVSDAMIARMNSAVESMERDGTARRLEKKYDTWSEK